MPVTSFNNIQPKIGSDVFIAPSAEIIGDVEIGDFSSVWFQTVIRGDVNLIRIGSKTNIQDLTMCHVTNKQAPKPAPLIIGNQVTIGHRVVVHGCTIEDLCLIGIGSIILDGAIIRKNSMIGAGSVVTPGVEIPSGVLAFGSPCQVKRSLTDAEKTFLSLSAEHYYQLSQKYKNG